MGRICISMSFCPTQVSKGVEILDRSVALHEKNRQNDIRRSPLQLSNCKSNGKFEARKQNRNSGSIKGFDEYGIGKGKMLTVSVFLYWVTRHQVHLHHLSTKGVSGVCLSA